MNNPSKPDLMVPAARRSFLGMTRQAFLASLCAAGALLAVPHARAQAIGDVFYIEMENHNFTQPSSFTTDQQILGNAAAPFQNSLVTSGNANAAETAYATAYYNAGNGVHPSEPNYVWAEAGSNLGTASDADPSAANHNLFTPGVSTYNGTVVNTLTAQMDAAGVSWKNYEEDVQYTGTSGSINAQKSVSGSGGTAPNGVTVTANSYYGTTQYNYAAKHNPMAFLTDSANKNLNQLSQLQTDLNNNTAARFNWITPNQFNDAHTALSGGYTYNGTHYTGDQAAVAQGDNFLSILIPQIEASQAFKNNGVIVIGYDESEGGDSTSFTIPEIVISPLAKGNAYASSVPMSHTSDLQTWEELFGLGYLNNAIPASATAATGGYNADGSVNDLSSMFVATAIPEIPSGAFASCLALGGLLLATRFRRNSAAAQK